MARGLDNCNPGNIRKTTDKWQGLADVQDDPSFFKFKSADWGIRAIAIILIGYYDRENLDTIAEIISRWAPPIENNTQAYIMNVSDISGFSSNYKLNLHEYSDICPLIKAIIFHENGEMPYGDDVINQGLARAGIEIPKKPLMATTVMKGAVTAVVGSASGLGGTLLDNTNMLAQYSDLGHYMHQICAVLTGTGIALTMIGKLRDQKKSIT